MVQSFFHNQIGLNSSKLSPHPRQGVWVNEYIFIEHIAAGSNQAHAIHIVKVAVEGLAVLYHVAFTLMLFQRYENVAVFPQSYIHF